MPTTTSRTSISTAKGGGGEKQARHYLAGLYEVFEYVAGSPGIGRARRELGEGIRSFPHGSHIVFYMPWQGEVAILRVVHGARDLEGLFEDYDPEPGIRSKRPEG